MLPYFPVPVSATVWGLILALSLTFSVAVRVPFAVGLKVTEIVQLELAGTLPPQVFTSLKSPGLAPANMLALTASTVYRLLVNFTFLAEGEGFEPPSRFRGKRFSRPPVSTAHPSLREASLS